MSLRIMIVDTYYPQFLTAFFRRQPELRSKPYEDQHKPLMAQGFGLGGSYGLNLRGLGHEVEVVIANCEPLQLQWAAENGIHLVHLLSVRSKPWLLKVLAAQVERFRPDVLYSLDIGFTDASFLQEIRPKVGLIVGQVACPLDPGLDLTAYDLLLSCLPSYVEMFRDRGVPSEYFRLAFEARILERVGESQRPFSVVFIGGYDTSHSGGNQLLEQIARELPVDYWGYGIDSLPRESPIRRSYRGQAWGIDMYRILGQSRIALNRHVDIAGSYAANVRLYETTGLGTLLVTDAKKNLHDLFEVGREVVAYGSPGECVELAKYYLEHEGEREAIARAGQRRTLREHMYRHRMEELSEIIGRYLRRPERASRKVLLPAAATQQDQSTNGKNRNGRDVLSPVALPLMRMNIALRSLGLGLLPLHLLRRLRPRTARKGKLAR